MQQDGGGGVGIVVLGHLACSFPSSFILLVAATGRHAVTQGFLSPSMALVLGTHPVSLVHLPTRFFEQEWTCSPEFLIGF